jgi:P27 family predicted phage terminase small subunit
LQLRIRDGLTEAEPDKLDAVPKAPAYLDAYARDMFDTLAPKLIRLHLLTELDEVLLILYCDAWSTWRHAREDLSTTKKLTPGERRSLRATLTKSRAEVMRLGIDLGLSPGARTRIDIGKARVDDEGADEFFSD